MLSRLVRRSIAPIAATCLLCAGARATILWSDLGTTLIHESGAGSDILGGAVQRDHSATDTLYFKFHVDPLSDVGTEEYFAAFQLFEGDTERLGVGNSTKAWAYSAFNTADTRNFNNVSGDVDLHSSRQESPSPGVYLPYELPRRGIENTIVFKVQYAPGGDDLVTVWMNPDLGPGATEQNQPAASTTTFNANASFNQLRIRHGGGGGGWVFSDMAIATSFSDFVASTGIDLTEKLTITNQSAALTIRNWQREQGLPQNTVRALAQTPDGYLWIGADDGITRFDGVRFVPFGLAQGWRNGRVQTMRADANGGLWIGTAGGGLVHWRDGRFETFGTSNGLPSETITSLSWEVEGRLWIGTTSGLAVWERPGIGKIGTTRFNGRTISSIIRDRQGVMWVGVVGDGVFRYEKRNFTRLGDSAIEGLLTDTHCLLEDHSGRIWIGAGNDYVICREADQWRRYRLPRHLARPYVTALAEEEDGTVWAGSVSEGLFQFRNGKLTAVNASSGLSDNFVQALCVDKEGDVWVGTAGGLNRLRRGNLALFGQNEGLGYGPVYGVAEVAPGQIWACKPNDGLYGLRGRAFSKLTADPAGRYRDVFSLLVCPDGICRVATSEGLLAFTVAGGGLLAEPKRELPDRPVTALARANNGEIAAGTRDGQVWLRRSGEWGLQTNFCQAHPVTCIVCETNGTVWIGTQGGGLHCYTGSVHTVFDPTDGLLSSIIRTLYLDPSGDVWAGTAGGGLTRIRHGTVYNYTSAQGLPDNTVSQIIGDRRGRLWLGTDRGLACVSTSELDRVAAGRVKSVFPDIYGRPEGMPSEECTSGFFPSGLKSQSGHLWFSTAKGIVVADPTANNSASPGPTPVLEEVLLDGAAISMLETNGASARATDSAGSKPLTIPAGKHSLEFRFTGLSLRAPERIRFRYRLQPEGTGADWVEAGTQRTVSYGYLPPGDYSFSVTACNSDGVWNPHVAKIEFTVLRYFWQSRWFVGLVILILISAVAGVVRLVEKRKHQRQLAHLEQERAVQRERARIAQDLHDDLGSSLTRLSLLSDLLKADKEIPTQVELHATRINQSAGQTVRALEEIVWALRPGSDTLQSLVDYVSHFSNELFEGDRTRCRLDFPHDLPSGPLPPEMRHNVFLIIKEALTNAMKHAGADEVYVHAKILPSAVQFTVRDNGKGFDTAAGVASSNGSRHGLENMQRRAEAMGAKLKVESGTGRGTTITLIVPFMAAVEAARG